MGYDLLNSQLIDAFFNVQTGRATASGNKKPRQARGRAGWVITRRMTARLMQ
jgi:hypothetical protein